MTGKLELWYSIWYASILVVEPDCAFNLYYCGHELKSGYPHVNNHTLYKCSSDGRNVSWVEDCTVSCQQDTQSYCACVPHAFYCGSQLHTERFSNFTSNALYHCSSIGYPHYQETCNGSCVVSSPSYCSQTCIAGNAYCGSDLGLLKGWSHGDAKTLYRCQTGGKSIENITTCRGKCKNGRCTEHCEADAYYCGDELITRGYPNAKHRSLYQCNSDGHTISWIEDCAVSCQSTGQSHCYACQPNTYYCGRELSVQSKRFRDLTSNALYRCVSSGYPVHKETCSGSCIVSSPSRCIQNCTVGKEYCGSDLGLLKGWSLGDVQTVYRCHTGGNSTEKVTSCRGRCVDGRCTEDCEVNAYYCGDELTSRGYSNVRHHSLYQCNSDGHTVSWIEDCTMSCQYAEQSYCYACQPHTSYCGSQLHSRRFSDLTHNALYQCSSSGYPVHKETCSGSCIVSSPSRCIQNCTVGKEYCGSDLGLLQGWSHGDIKTVYRCQAGGNSTEKVTSCRGKCENGRCIHCEANIYYCGHELTERGYLNTAPDTLYQCNSDYQTVSCIEDCAVSCENGERSYCKGCRPNYHYCGSELHIKGYPNLTGNALYHCSSAGYPVHQKTCSGSCIISRESYCSQNCSVESTYCGTDLELLENWSVSPTEKDTLYICMTGSSATGSFCPRGCVSGAQPHCRQTCVPGVDYCSLDVRWLEGWSHGEEKTVYRCHTDGVSIEKVTSCRGRCVNGNCTEDCSIGKYYCGHELNKLESWNVPHEKHNHLYKCTNGSEVDEQSDCGRSKCLSTGDQPHCGCEQSLAYCGSELYDIGYRGLRNDAVYLCQSGEQPHQIQVCLKKCITSKGNSSCEGSCITEGFYCGSQLPAIGNDANVLYRCIDGSHIWQKQCSSGCITREKGTSYCAAECCPGRLYCGYELEKIGFTISESNSVYLCTNGTSIAVNETCNVKCEKDQRAHCREQCTPGLLYCGHELQEAGFAGGTMNALYLCTGSQTVIEVRVCTSPCIGGTLNSTCAPKNLALEVSICGTLYSAPTLPFIREGQTSKREAYLWMVSLKNATNSHRCGGVLIHPQWVLTAAHCVEDNDGPLESVVIGEYKLHEYDRGQVNVSVARVIRYPRYDPTVMQTGDLALLRLSKQVTYSRFVRPACLPQNANDIVQPDTNCAVAGWGKMLRKGMPNTMQHGRLEVFRHNVCAEKFNTSTATTDFTYNSSVMICAGTGSVYDALPCQGDSGGPLMCQKPDSSWVVHGIVSYGFEKACYDIMLLPAVFTKVAAFVEWIQKVISEESSTVVDYATDVERSDVEYFKMMVETNTFRVQKYTKPERMHEGGALEAVADALHTVTISRHDQDPKTTTCPLNK